MRTALHASAAAVVSALRERGVALLTAPPGAGKSTLLPLELLDEYHSIVLLEPRRLAARAVAERLAYNLGEDIGQTVGYTVRFERRCGPAMRLEVVTEGILTRRLQGDQLLEGVDLVLFDELHERSLECDVALALCRDLQRELRPELHLLCMSATLDTRALSQALGGAPVVDIPAQTHNLTVTHTSEDCQPETCAEMAARGVVEELRGTPSGDVLVFLPGQGEIHRCHELLRGAVGGHVDLVELYGSLSLSEQRRALTPSAPGRRKVVLATNIAETSLTVPGVRVVVDSGLCRVSRFDAGRQMDALTTERISLDMATQRSGRAAREGDGRCLRLYTLATELRMHPQREPQMLTSDLAPLALSLALWGTAAEQLPWLTPPPAGALARARELLQALGALDQRGVPTTLAHDLARLPCHPRIAKMLLGDRGEGTGERAQGTDLAALLEERDPLANDPEAGCDLEVRLQRLQQLRRGGHIEGPWRRIDLISRQLVVQGTRHRGEGTGHRGEGAGALSVGALLATAYPERIASLSANGVYTLSGGGTARLDKSDALSGAPWLCVADCTVYPDRPGRIFLAARLSPDELQPFCQRSERTAWDERSGRVVSREVVRLGLLTLGERAVPHPSPEAAVEALTQAVVDNGERLLNFDRDTEALQARLSTLNIWHPELVLPPGDARSLCQSAPEWLPALVGKQYTAEALRHLDMREVILGRLTWAQQEALRRLAPESVEVPSGSRIRLEWRGTAEPPLLRVRLQELFGLTDTPRVDGGLRQVLVELLSPGYKPVQRTTDLRSFWTGAYHQVRAELQRRYPRHAWPDDPLTALPIRGPKRRG